MIASQERIVVVGAGLVGSLLAIYLARRGYHTEVCEHRADLREAGEDRIRSSINLSLCERGLRALDRVGLGDKIRAYSVPCYGRVIHDVRGGLTCQSYGAHGEATYAILRNDLNRVLIDEAESRWGVVFRFQQRCLDLELESNTLQFQDLRTGRTSRRKATRIFGADGVFSQVRLKLQRTLGFNYGQTYLEHGYTELTVPPGHESRWHDYRSSVHLWPRGQYMLLGLPNLDGSLVCSLHLPLKGPLSFASLENARKLSRFLRNSFPDVVDLMPKAEEEFFSHRINYLVSIRCFPWTYQGRIALIGDAAHAIVPFYAQGVNAGFEDCDVLEECLNEFNDDWNSALRAYERSRKPNTDAISSQSLRHFIELRDLVGQPKFHLKKRIESTMQSLYPDRFTPLYSMITFAAIPYAEAVRRGYEQESLIQKILAASAIDELPESELERLIQQFVETSFVEDPCPELSIHEATDPSHAGRILSRS